MAAKISELLPLKKVEADFRTAKDGGWDEWEVLEFRVSESLGEPYSGTIDIASRNRSVDFSLLLGKSCALEIRRGDRRRFFKGMIFRVECLGTNPVASVARIGFAAALWALHHGQDSRVFEGRTAPQIIEEVLNEGLEPFGRKARVPMLERGPEPSGGEAAISAGKEYAKRDYCTQYQESDLDFVQRLMADEGLFYYFDQGNDGDKETVVVVDSNYECPQIDTMGTKEVEDEEVGASVAALTGVAARKKTRFSAKLVDDATGEPIPGVKLDLRLVDGSMHNLVSGSDGLIEVLDVEPGNHTLSRSIGGATMKSALEFVSVGESSSSGAVDGASKAPAKGTQRPAPEEPGGAQSYSVVAVERYKVKRGDTLEKIAAKHDLGRATLAYFNWGVYSPPEIEGKLCELVGCTEKDRSGGYVFTDEDEPGIIFIPKPWRAAELAAGKQHTVRLRPILPTEPALLPDLHLDLEIDAEAPDAQDEVIRLEATDGSWKHELKVSALSEYKPDLVKLVFPSPPRGKRFNLVQEHKDEGVAFSILEGWTYAQIREEAARSDAEEQGAKPEGG